MANVPSFQFLVPACRFLHPRSGCWYRRSVFVPSFRFWGSREHPRKPPFWKPPFCKPPNIGVIWSCPQLQDAQPVCESHMGLSNTELGWAPSILVLRPCCFGLLMVYRCFQFFAIGYGSLIVNCLIFLFFEERLGGRFGYF